MTFSITKLLLEMIKGRVYVTCDYKGKESGKNTLRYSQTM
jgi:hypothetical protein